MKQLLSLLLTSITLSGCSSTAPEPSPNFEEAVRRHVEAIPARDIETIRATITNGDELLLVLPNGAQTKSKTEYLDFHDMFFGVEGWTMEAEPIAFDEYDGYGHALYRTTFDEDGPEGPLEPGQSWLTLGFALQDGEWRLVHDQNTRITQ